MVGKARIATIGAAVIALLLTAQSAPRATEDITAVYSAFGRDTTRVEIAANGDMRIQDGDNSYLLSHGGQEYFVTAGPGGPIVERVADIMAATDDQKIETHESGMLVADGEAVVNGRTGTTWWGGTSRARHKGKPGIHPSPAFVTSKDPALVPIGRAFARRLAVQDRMFSPPGDNKPLSDLFSTAAPLRFYFDELSSLSKARLAPSRFEIPAPPEPAEVVRDRWGRKQAEPDADAFGRTTFTRAIFASGRLWLLSDSGKIVTIAEGDKKSADQPSPEPALDICLADGAPLIVAGTATGRQWTVERWKNGAWQRVGAVDSGGDRLVALSCTPKGAVLLTNKRMIDIAGDPHPVLLSEPIMPGVIATSLVTGPALFIGLDRGEWGGGLLRIDRATGKVTAIDSRSSKAPCQGPLNAACDPVNGIAPEPGKPDCYIAAIGLVHMVPHGRLVEICEGRVKPIYFKPYTLEVAPHFDPANPEPFRTVAFFGLTPVGGSLRAVGLDGVYRIEAGGNIGFQKMPRFENVNGIWLSFAIPDVVLVQTSINQRVSLSGSVPMIVPR